MEKYIVLDGETYDLILRDNEKVAADSGSVKLADIPEGDAFKIGKNEMIVLEQSGDTTAVILKDLLIDPKAFGPNNNFEDSYVERACDAFAAEIERLVGHRNLVEHTVDLTSDDGLKDYGKIKRKASLLTAELYRRYVYILDKHKIDGWWWLVTAHSTKTHDDTTWVKCVSPSGCINNYCCNYVRGVRPFCILKSCIFVSK